MGKDTLVLKKLIEKLEVLDYLDFDFCDYECYSIGVTIQNSESDLKKLMKDIKTITTKFKIVTDKFDNLMTVFIQDIEL